MVRLLRLGIERAIPRESDAPRSLVSHSVPRSERAGLRILARPTAVPCGRQWQRRPDTLSGTFLSKVFEGPYSSVRTWIEDTKAFVAGKGMSIRQLFVYYTTCPKCAKKHGTSYVVMLARI